MAVCMTGNGAKKGQECIFGNRRASKGMNGDNDLPAAWEREGQWLDGYGKEHEVEEFLPRGMEVQKEYKLTTPKADGGAAHP